MRTLLISLVVTVVLSPMLASAKAPGNQILPQTGYGTFDPDSAWFTASSDRRTVQWCFEVSPDFAVQDPARIEAAVENAFALWRRYVAQKRPDLAAPFDLYPEFGGTCGGGMDLVFLFGGQAELASHPNREDSPVFNVRTDFDYNSRWSRGFVWLHPGNPYTFRRFDGEFVQEYSLNWSDDFAFETVILHEVGHLFGNSEITGTIMDREFLNRHIRLTEQSDARRPSIDGQRELLAQAFTTQRHSRSLPAYVNNQILAQLRGETPPSRSRWLAALIDIKRVYQANGSTRDQITLRNHPSEPAFSISMNASTANATVVDTQPILRQCFLVTDAEVCAPAAAHEISFSIATTTAATTGTPAQVMLLYNMAPKASEPALPAYAQPSFLALEWIDEQGNRQVLAQSIKQRSCWGRLPGDGCEPAH